MITRACHTNNNNDNIKIMITRAYRVSFLPLYRNKTKKNDKIKIMILRVSYTPKRVTIACHMPRSVSLSRVTRKHVCLNR